MDIKLLFIIWKPKRLLHLDKWRKPTPCPGSHTGAADSAHRRAHRSISAQRNLEIRALKRERRKWAEDRDIFQKDFITEVSRTMIDFENVPDVLTIPELQKVLRIGRNTAYRLVQSKKIRSIRIGKSIRVPREYVKEFVENQNSLHNNGEVL